MGSQNLQPSTAQFDVYVQKIRDALEQGQALHESLAMQGLLLVYFNILYSAYDYIYDLKKSKKFTSIQDYAFHLLRDDVRKYRNLLGTALKDLDTTPCFEPDYDCCVENYMHTNKAYTPLVELSKTYLPKGPYSYSEIEKNHIDYWTLFSKGGTTDNESSIITRYFLSNPKNHAANIARNKQVIMKLGLGEEIGKFYLTRNNYDNLRGIDFFYWFGYVINSLWTGPLNQFGPPSDVSPRVIELLMATKNMGDKYFNPTYAKLYVDMLENSGTKPGRWSFEDKHYLTLRDALLGNAEAHNR